MKLKLMEMETETEVLRTKLTEAEDKLEGVHSKLSVYVEKVKFMSTREVELKISIKELEAEKERLEARLTQQQVTVSEVRERLLRMVTDGEEDTEETGRDDKEKLSRDNEELREINGRLQSQLSVARAAQLAAQRTELPLLSQKLQDGIQVLSLSERLFLMQNTNVGKSFSLQMEHLEVKGWDISKEYEEESRKVELLIQKLLEPDREKGTIGVKYKYPDSKVTALQI